MLFHYWKNLGLIDNLWHTLDSWTCIRWIYMHTLNILDQEDLCLNIELPRTQVEVCARRYAIVFHCCRLWLTGFPSDCFHMHNLICVLPPLLRRPKLSLHMAQSQSSAWTAWWSTDSHIQITPNGITLLNALMFINICTNILGTKQSFIHLWWFVGTHT